MVVYAQPESVKVRYSKHTASRGEAASLDPSGAQGWQTVERGAGSKLRGGEERSSAQIDDGHFGSYNDGASSLSTELGELPVKLEAHMPWNTRLGLPPQTERRPDESVLLAALEKEPGKEVLMTF